MTKITIWSSVSIGESIGCEKMFYREPMFISSILWNSTACSMWSVPRWRALFDVRGVDGKPPVESLPEIEQYPS